LQLNSREIDNQRLKLKIDILNKKLHVKTDQFNSLNSLIQSPNHEISYQRSDDYGSTKPVTPKHKGGMKLPPVGPNRNISQHNSKSGNHGSHGNAGMVRNNKAAPGRHSRQQSTEGGQREGHSSMMV
jgi:hypothetical protein